ncbi:MAG: phosphoglucosamine mutase [Candidatus Moranbacteria bacterium]|nr:phosphoglucosamine mutase [Candidatus Moranbacteria bacterium]
MSLMVSVSGIRGIIGEDLTPKNLVSYTQAFAAWVTKGHAGEGKPRIVIGRDTRPSGAQIVPLLVETLALSGVDVVDLGVATTPTVEIAVTENKADAGIIVTASHNPIEWNALKLLNRSGEFLDADELADFLGIAEREAYVSARWDGIGSTIVDRSADEMHIGKILALPFVDTGVIEKSGLSVLVDAVEGAGSDVVPDLCSRLGIGRVETLACGGTGIFPRNPEPIADNLSETVSRMKESGCDFGIIVDPDVDRLALIQEDGELFGEEYTLVACADYYLKKFPGTVVNNLSSSRALRDIAERYGRKCVSAKVGEANVVTVMKEERATIGGEGNGGIILPSLHYGRDALIGIAIFVTAFAEWRAGRSDAEEKTLSAFRKTFPAYFMAKKKLEVSIPKEELAGLFAKIAGSHPDAVADTRDGLKLDFPEYWVHLRASNTEPIIRIYTEAKTAEDADRIADEFMREISLAE